MSLRVLKPGLLTTVQDLGRHGYQKDGVVVGGAMDARALRTANLLVGNEENAAGLEMTLVGASFVFEKEALVALTGGDLAPIADGVPLPMGRPVYLPEGSVLEVKAARSGCRAYLAVAGGLEVPEVLGSRSTYVRGGFGGHEGRALQAGDRLDWGAPSEAARRRMDELRGKLIKESVEAKEWSRAGGEMPFSSVSWFVRSYEVCGHWENLESPPSKVTTTRPTMSAMPSVPVIRVLRGSEFELFDTASRDHFFNVPFRVTPQSDRMGYRLEAGDGERLKLSRPLEMISEAVAMGTVQVPSEGNPIVLMADRQTTGGYPRVAQVISVDLPLLAQVKPGDEVRFQEIELAEAQALFLQREAEWMIMRQGLRFQE